MLDSVLGKCVIKKKGLLNKARGVNSAKEGGHQGLISRDGSDKEAGVYVEGEGEAGILWHREVTKTKDDTKSTRFGHRH